MNKIQAGTIGAVVSVLLVVVFVAIAEVLFASSGRHGVRVSYGQPFVLLTLPVVALIGMLIGLFLHPRKNSIGVTWVSLVFLIFVLYQSINSWLNSIERYGHDISHFFLYGPTALLPIIGVSIILRKVFLISSRKEDTLRDKSKE